MTIDKSLYIELLQNEVHRLKQREFENEMREKAREMENNAKRCGAVAGMLGVSAAEAADRPEWMPPRNYTTETTEETS